MYREARLLDSRRFDDWLDLLTDDVKYWMPLRSNRYPANKEGEISREDELAIMDEDKDSLTRRIRRLDSGMAWAEDPPSRTRHFVSNIEVEPGQRDSELRVYSNFIMYRTRGETEEDFYVGSREDVLRRENGQLRVAYRKVVLDQTVLLAKNVSNFF
ncbi:Biphenyl dioxygenase subunit beta [Geodia barretti]|uniref:Biphenyl dioxygenase subunit beta n=1 Tax=Geodia barretti TaxID=519541 RepID=A0AA35TFP9_GEOBA|nr:Biphenyl dioxygenase subunit beta [Geodia barretti]